MIPIRIPGDEKKPSKHHSKGVRVDGIFFRSTGEAKRWAQLQLLERYGQIRALCRQVAYPLHTVDLAGKKVKISRYDADFEYEERQDDGTWLKVTEDFKGQMTPRYKMCRKWMLAEYGIAIRETGERRPAKRARKKRGV